MPAHAQTYDLCEEFDMQPSSYAQLNNKQYLGADLGYTWTQCQAEFPAFVSEWLKLHTSAEFLRLTKFTAAFNELSWRDTFSGGQSRAKINICGGSWWANWVLRANMGTIEGSGSADNYGQGGTEIQLDKGGYLNFGGTEFNLMATWNYGWTGAPVGFAGDWSHFTKVKNIHFTGSCPTGVNDPSYTSSGFVAQRPGETFILEDCYFEKWNDYGFVCNDGPAPCRLSNNSFFYCGKAGTYFKGTSISVIEIDGISGDFHHQLVYAPQGGNFTIISPKVEAHGPANVDNAAQTQGFGDFLGTFGGFHQVTIIGGQLWAHGCIIDAGVVTMGTKTNGYNSKIEWIGGSWKGVQNIILDLDNGNRVPHGLQLNQGPVDVTYTTGAGGYASDEHKRPITLLKSTCAQLPFIPESATTAQPTGAFNYTACGGGPVPPPPPTPVACVWTKTGTGPCVNGVSSDVYAGSPAGCTGSPPMTTSPCTTPTTKTFGPYTVNTTTGSTNQCVDLTKAPNTPVVGVTKITVSMVPTAFTWGRIVGTGSGKPSLQVGTGGFLYWNGSKASTTAFTLNVQGTVTATIPATTITTILQTDCMQGGAQRGNGIMISLQ